MSHDPSIAYDEEAARDFDLFDPIEQNTWNKLVSVGSEDRATDAIVALECASLALEHVAYHVKASQTAVPGAQEAYFMVAFHMLEQLAVLYEIVEQGRI